MKKLLFLICALCCTALLPVSCSSFVAIERSEYASSDSAFIKYLKNENVPYTKNNHVDILNGAHVKFDSLLADIEKAEHHIHLEYFNFRNDSINKVLIGALAKKAKEGVEVRAMFDAFGNMSNDRPLKKKDLEAIRAQGIEIIKFDPIVFPWINHAGSRDHRKIVVIDGKVGYTGGMNIADRYVDGVRGGIWRDVHIRIEGEAVAMLQTVFVTDWAFVTDGITLDKPRYFPATTVENICPMQIATSGPDSPYASIKHSYFAAIGRAKRYIYISTPYLMPDNSILTALTVAALSGVDVRILIPVRGDNIVVAWAGYSYVDTLMEAGVKVYLYRKGFNHSKFIVIDDELCTVGSANLDYRSFNDDFEVQALIYENSVAQELKGYFLDDLADSKLITPDERAQRSKWRKIMESLSRLLAPLF